MTAPTEEEIRAELARGWTHRSAVVGQNTAQEFESAFMSASCVLDGLYDLEDMRPSEVAAMDLLTGPAVKAIRDKARAEINEALVRVMVDFAARHPDIPRATREVTAA